MLIYFSTNQRNILLIFTLKAQHVADYKFIAFYQEFLLQETTSIQLTEDELKPSCVFPIWKCIIIINRFSLLLHRSNKSKLIL